MKIRRYCSLLLVIIIVFSSFIGCNENVNGAEDPQSEAAQDRVSFDGGFHVNLDYFHADRYAATITEDEDHVFWADNDGLHKYSKDTKNTVLLLEGKKINGLVICENFLYYVVDEEILYRIDVNTKDVEMVFKQDKKYLSQIHDYTVVDGKVFFLNTHSLFYYDIATKSVKELKNTTVANLQVVGDDIYFIDHGERTDTIYVYSMTDGTCEIVQGDGEYVSMKPEHHDFRVVDDKMYYCQAMPGGTYLMDLDGESKIIANGCSTFVCAPRDFEGIYLMSHGLNTSHLYFYDMKGNKTSACSYLLELDLNNGVAVVNGYVYYNSGYERILNEYGHYIYKYYSNPVAKKISQSP